MGMANQGMKLPTIGTTTTPNGKTFNTNPAGMSPIGSQQTMPYGMPPQGGINQFGGSSSGQKLDLRVREEQQDMAQYDAMQKDIAKQREAFMAQNPQANEMRQTNQEPIWQQNMNQPQTAQAAQGGMGGTGRQPPSPQQLSQGLQQQAMMQRQMPMFNQRQPQAAGRMPPQLPMRGRR